MSMCVYMLVRLSLLSHFRIWSSFMLGISSSDPGEQDYCVENESFEVACRDKSRSIYWTVIFADVHSNTTSGVSVSQTFTFHILGDLVWAS